MIAAVERDWIDWIVSIFTIVGVVIAIVQSIRAGSIASAASAAVQRAEKRLTSNHVLSFLGQMETLEIELNQAVESPDTNRALSTVIRIRAFSSELTAVVETRKDDESGEVGAVLNELSNAVADAQMNLYDGDDVKVACKDLRRAMASCGSVITKYASRLRLSAEEQDDNG